MEAVIILLVIIISLAAVDWASLTWGVDTRESYPDDHARPLPR